MVFARAAQPPITIERRAAGRARCDCPARLQTPAAQWLGRLWDLSETGARVHVENPPAAGTLALIHWQANELFCRVQWATADMCGVLFERPIGREVVSETLGHETEPAETGPAANVGNIPAGRRRVRLSGAEDS